MKIKTHVLIANKIHEHIENYFEQTLSRRRFVFGNIKPDLFRKLKCKNHSMRDSLDYVLDEINKYHNNTRYKDNHSIHIGMINHYLTDFFCSKHYFKEDKVGFFKHLKYEEKLHNVIENMDIKNILESSNNRLFDNLSGSFKDIIKKLECEYLKQPPSIENDILFALSAPLIACRYILQQDESIKLIECTA